MAEEHTSPRPELPEHEEMLIMRLADGECSWFERWRARRLVDRSSAARELFLALSHSAKLLNEHRFAETLKHSEVLDLWNGIEQRILAEERAAMYTKPRAIEAVPRGRNPWGLPSLAPRFAWAGSGALVAAMCTFVLFGSGSPSAPSYVTPGLIASSRAGEVGEGTPLGSPQVIPESIPTTYQVDWMRGAGRVQLYGDSNRRSPVMWVRRRDPATGKVTATIAPRAEFPERFQ